jgi:molybdopterin-guanine dinucleotide biosynthesis protein A
VADRYLTGIILVGGSSTRFGSPKALARLGDETLAERAWRLLRETCAETIAVGKRADALPLPFPILDDGSAVRAPIAGLVAGLLAARHPVAVVVPVDTPLLTERSLRALADACADAAVPQTGPLPGAYRAEAALPVLERRLAEGRLALRDALTELRTQVVELDPWELANVNEPADLAAAERRAVAMAAAVEAAAAHGLHDLEPRIVSDWNDTIVHLRPLPLVARVATSTLRADAEAALAFEVEVAREVAARGGPALAPALEPPPGPHRAGGLVLTFWPFVETVARELSPAEIARSLRALHEAFAGGPPLPPLARRLDRTEALLRAAPALAEDDRAFLAAALRDLRRRFEAFGRPERALHGGPHGGNLLRSRDGLRWIDLDTACRGPAEWDFAYLPDETAPLSELDRDALEVARLLVSACVAVWCWAQLGRAPEVDEAAHFHLRHLRAAL